MCGLFGVISTKGSVNTDALTQCTSTLRHRGPDVENIYISKNGQCGLGHTRLSILDLSEGANQPFYSDCGRYVMVYNGEVYNYKELSEKLGTDARSALKTSGDTEVILKAFIKWGLPFVEQLNGMFAIAIYDIEKETLFLFRDRMGIKPLYYYRDDNLFIFGSELKSILEWPGIKDKLSIDPASFAAYMTLGYVPEPRSIYDSVAKFPAGSMAELSTNGKMEIKSYWKFEDKISQVVVSDEVQAEEQLDNLLHSSVRKRLISDVPLGTFLSGGIDSSTVTAIAAQNCSTPLNTFSIGFKDKKFNESEYAKKIADHLGTHHTEFMLSEKDAMPYLADIIHTYDEPFADSSAIPTMLISRLARQHVTVALTGDGGDEQFMGYGAYSWADRLATPLIGNQVFRFLAYHVLSKGNNRTKRAAHMFHPRLRTDLRAHIFSQEQYLFAEYELPQLLKHPYPMDSMDLIDVNNVRTAAEHQSFFDMKYYLKDDLLVKVDRASMKYGLECRVPLLDHELVEFSVNLSKSLKIKNGETKYLLKKVLYKYIPKSFFERPKWGFSVPLANWMKGDLSYLIEDYANEQLTCELGYFNPSYVDRLIKQFKSGDDYLYNRIWLIILWQKWIKEHHLA